MLLFVAVVLLAEPLRGATSDTNGTHNRNADCVLGCCPPAHIAGQEHVCLLALSSEGWWERCHMQPTVHPHQMTHCSPSWYPAQAALYPAWARAKL